jgi:hypothetical protein
MVEVHTSVTLQIMDTEIQVGLAVALRGIRMEVLDEVVA